MIATRYQARCTPCPRVPTSAVGTRTRYVACVSGYHAALPPCTTFAEAYAGLHHTLSRRDNTLFNGGRRLHKPPAPVRWGAAVLFRCALGPRGFRAHIPRLAGGAGPPGRVGVAATAGSPPWYKGPQNTTP